MRCFRFVVCSNSAATSSRENLRQALRHFGAWQIEFGFAALQCHAVQELQRAAHDVAAAVCELALFEQVQQVVLDFVLCDLIW